MTVRLTVPRAEWQAHLAAAAAGYGPGLVPVVKGNGYGFGRPVLHDLAASIADDVVEPGTVCVGTVHELHDVPIEMTPVVLTPVLTPALTPPPGRRAVLTVGSIDHVRALDGWQGRVIVKLASSMRRYGASVVELPALLQTVAAAQLTVHGFGLHLPFAGDDAARLAEIEEWLPHLPPTSPLWVSHLGHASFAALRTAHPDRRFLIRVGTALWHGVPRGEFLRLSADVLGAQRVKAGDTAGYFHTRVPVDGTLIAVGAGSTNGIAALADADPTRRSPFHFARQRMPLLERPHMHTSMVIVPDGQPCPQVGEWLDVQWPLTTTAIDELEWI
jgi:alanine racemase